MTYKNVIVAGASGTIGAPIVAALLDSGLFNVSALTRTTSKAIFPLGVAVKRADLSSRESLVTALRGQDVLICTLNDEATFLQAGLIEAAFEAGVKRYMPNEWASHDLNIQGTPMDEIFEGKKSIIRLLEHKVELAKKEGTVFTWTGLNNGVFFDWALQASFLDITLLPTAHAKIWDSGNSKFSTTTLSTVARAVVAILTTAEVATRNSLVNIQSFSTSQNEIVAMLEKVVGETWAIENTTTLEQMEIASANLENNEFVEAFYIWVRAWMFSGRQEVVLKEWEKDNRLLGVESQSLEDVIVQAVGGR
ncbi:hypothetical protein VTL71DRAFT_6945 [Oculimacula yallundae]|uniref:NmrA-like domain-containing protein n=1 Tax=Oculimacula yallundae TaxID=86028 RepID=A0ABR4BXW8_9HELO